MENFIDHIAILNFKSIRNLKLEGLTRINLFIGKPNVGKSNILEAFGVFSLPYSQFADNKKITEFIRIQHEPELFFDGNVSEPSVIKTNMEHCDIEYKVTPLITDNYGNSYSQQTDKLLNFNFDSAGQESFQLIIDENLAVHVLNNPETPPILKKYVFIPGKNQTGNKISFLLPPNGKNLFKIIEENNLLKTEIKELFREYNLKLVFDKASRELKITKPPQNDEIFLIPYHSIADTLQRIIFYKTAIASNQNSVLIFEEPEAHAFPPYIVHITQEIIDANSNQFILSTHSPYVLDYFLENARDELSIFMVDYKNGETVANKLSKEDMDDIYSYGIDLFTNYETFLK
ncbi:MAG TPA: ATPase [Mariniphaga anaerophila]|uniref:ATPase n=1 Tax=Mariniphaga anaerophila TaxID=1484053 RepID=A0A831LM33_9BACT|nr:ATPase [Mariniphaga anaerophila]